MSNIATPENYRRRNRLPVIAVILLLAIGAVVVWTTVMEPTAAAARGCNAPGKAPATSSGSATSGATTGSGTASTRASGTGTASATGSAASTEPETTTSTLVTGTTTLGVLVEHATLVSTRPANPATVNLTVLNASKTSGLARSVTDAWRTAGFESIQPAKNDPLYPAFDLRCYGEIRYGDAGTQAARTVLMVAPCAQLVLDGRVDDSVEFAVGAKYDVAAVTDAVINDLTAIRDAAAAPAVIEGLTASPKPSLTIPPLPSAVCPS